MPVLTELELMVPVPTDVYAGLIGACNDPIGIAQLPPITDDMLDEDGVWRCKCPFVTRLADVD